MFSLLSQYVSNISNNSHVHGIKQALEICKLNVCRQKKLSKKLNPAKKQTFDYIFGMKKTLCGNLNTVRKIQSALRPRSVKLD